MLELVKKLLNTYAIFARYLPALLSALPVFVFWFYLSDNVQLEELISFILSLKFLGRVTFSVAFLYIYSLVIREVSKHFQRKYFTGDSARGFPTTYLMMYSDNTFSNNYKDKYRKLISNQFGFELLNKEEEEANLIEAKKRLNEATDLVKAEIQDGYLVLKHNIWFGFYRNFIGGTIISMFFCIAGILLGWYFVEDNKALIFMLGVLFFIYFLIFLFRRSILVRNGEAYAKQLISEFIVGKASRP